jgi:hypothetical protein
MKDAMLTQTAGMRKGLAVMRVAAAEKPSAENRQRVGLSIDWPFPFLAISTRPEAGRRLRTCPLP